MTICLSMRFFFVSLIFFFLTSCSPPSLDDYHEESKSLVHALSEVLKHTQTRDELIENMPQLKRLFNNLVDVMIACHQCQNKMPRKALTAEEHRQSDALRQEINRLCRIQGCRELIEQCQEESLHKLDKYLSRTRHTP